MRSQARKAFITIVFLLSALLVFDLSRDARAQSDTSSATSSAAEAPEAEQGFVEDIITRAEKDEYLEPSLQNISKMYWALGKFDLADDQLIDDYLLINECDMYLKYFHDDFQWENIRQATRDHISKNMGQFPTRFELLSVVTLGRYNIETQEFELDDESRLTNLRRLDVAQNLLGLRQICNKGGEIYQYPPNIIVVLNRPLSIEKFPVKRELAKLYLEEAKSFYDDLPPHLQSQRYQRTAFLRLKIKITQYKETVTVMGGALRGVVFGMVEGYEVYADQDKLKPLYEKKMETSRFRRIKEADPETEETPPPAEPKKAEPAVDGAAQSP